MSRDWNQEIANIEWDDLLIHIGVGLAVAVGIYMIANGFGYPTIGLIIGLAANWIGWPAREMWQTGRFSVKGWSVKKWLEGFAPGVIVTPFMLMLI